MTAFLEQVPVKDLVSGERRLVYVDQGDSLEKALQVLHDNNILAAPVRAPESVDKQGEQGRREVKFSGVLSVLDVAALVARDAEACGAGATVAGAMRKTPETWHMLVLDPHATVGQAMEFLGGRGFHRALVPNVCLSDHAPNLVPLPSALVEELLLHARGEAYHVLSQWDLATWILKNEGRFGLALAQSMESVGLEGGKVLGVLEDAPLSLALHRMAGHTVSGLAVVDRLDAGEQWAAGDARVLDTLSASDLRGCSLAELRDAEHTTVGSFLEKRRGGKARRRITCHKDTEIRAVLKAMLTNGVHRLWVTTRAAAQGPGESPPTLEGVVSLSDVIRVMRILPFKSSAEGEEDEATQYYDSLMWHDWDSLATAV